MSYLMFSFPSVCLHVCACVFVCLYVNTGIIMVELGL